MRTKTYVTYTYVLRNNGMDMITIVSLPTLLSHDKNFRMVDGKALTNTSRTSRTSKQEQNFISFCRLSVRIHTNFSIWHCQCNGSYYTIPLEVKKNNYALNTTLYTVHFQLNHEALCGHCKQHAHFRAQMMFAS